MSLNDVDPETGNVIDLSTKHLEAQRAQVIWANTPFKARTACLLRMRDHIASHAENLAETIAVATGKTLTDAYAAEVVSCTMACSWYAKNTKRILAPKRLPPSNLLFLNKCSQLHYLPLGVIGIISPWNYPLSIPFGEILMALMAGNAVFLKVDPKVQAVGLAIRDIMRAGELPDGLFHLVDGDPPRVADAFFAMPVDKLFFTGSVRVGKELMAKASRTLTPLSLELGGNDPMVVLEDADLERATNGACWGGFQNAGQTCAGIERIYVDERVYQPFLEMLAEKTRRLIHGPWDAEVDMGALCTDRQLASVTQHVEESCKMGARIVAQSQPVEGIPEGRFYPATVMAETTHAMPIMREETFGPVVCVMPFKTVDEAITLANDSHLALTASIWSRDTQRAKKLALRIESGVTTINDHLYTHALSETPWGGWKLSGFGRTHGALGLQEMCHAKVVNWDRLPLKRNLYWYPADRSLQKTLRFAIGLLASRSPLQYLVNLAQLARALPRRVLTSRR